MSRCLGQLLPIGSGLLESGLNRSPACSGPPHTALAQFGTASAICGRPGDLELLNQARKPTEALAKSRCPPLKCSKPKKRPVRPKPTITSLPARCLWKVGPLSTWGLWLQDVMLTISDDVPCTGRRKARPSRPRENKKKEELTMVA